ncbi:hypothetical protein Bca101_082894 [Brassica carinata]
MVHGTREPQEMQSEVLPGLRPSVATGAAQAPGLWAEASPFMQTFPASPSSFGRTPTNPHHGGNVPSLKRRGRKPRHHVNQTKHKYIRALLTRKLDGPSYKPTSYFSKELDTTVKLTKSYEEDHVISCFQT